MNRIKTKLSLLVWSSAACASLGLAVAQTVSLAAPRTSFQQYAGPPRAIGTVAVIRLDGSDTVQIVSLDRERLAPVEKGIPAPHRDAARGARGRSGRSGPRSHDRRHGALHRRGGQGVQGDRCTGVRSRGGWHVRRARLRGRPVVGRSDPGGLTATPGVARSPRARPATGRRRAACGRRRDRSVNRRCRARGHTRLNGLTAPFAERSAAPARAHREPDHDDRDPRQQDNLAHSAARLARRPRDGNDVRGVPLERPHHTEWPDGGLPLI